ncbi:NAD-dependent epimerase/dehydratase family protein [Nonomuraea sp. CA-143628]|uniref:NAD-dependent epimerase/dehydratase family protein n=1 Tax=Nonomuraea sp. CA-143628 TaxID=3239997 RepID=UPI003D931BC5
MRLLILGGTAFVGRAIASQSVARGWAVMTFNRGMSGSDVAGVKTIRGDRYSSADLAELAAAGTWDAIVDTSGYVPRNVLRTATALRGRASRYLFMSTVSVYAAWPVESLDEDSTLLDCPPDADESFGQDTEDGPTRYGYQKSGCEAAVQLAFGESQATLLRSGVVLGPNEYVGRLPWWLRRVAEGGRVLAPGDPDRTIQPVDVRDLATFALHAIEHDLSGPFNVTAPTDFDTFGGLLSHCKEATQSVAELVWVPDDDLVRAGVRQWSEIPLWRTFPGVWQVSSARAHAAGLVCRPLRSTVHDTWAWMATLASRQIVNERSGEIGLSKEREAQVLATVIT